MEYKQELMNRFNDDINVARKLTIAKCIFPAKLINSKNISGIDFSPKSNFIVDGEYRDRAIWAADLFISGPSAFEYLENGSVFWKNSLLAISAKQYSNGKLPACVSLDLKYRPLSPFFDTYGMWWVLSAYDYLNRTKDLHFKSVFLQVFKKAFNYYLARLDKDNFFVSKFPDFHWNWTVLRPRKSVIVNALFYRVQEIANEFNLNPRVDLSKFKEKFNEYFWNDNANAYIDNPKSKTIFLDGNAISIIFGLADRDHTKMIFETLRNMESEFGSISYIGKPTTISSWHKDLICPFSTYLYVRSLLKEGFRKKAKENYINTLVTGLNIARNYNENTIPEFWKNNGKLGAEPALDQRSKLSISLCHGWSTFGDLKF